MHQCREYVLMVMREWRDHYETTEPNDLNYRFFFELLISRLTHSMILDEVIFVFPVIRHSIPVPSLP
jgi:hypothetical protein